MNKFIGVLSASGLFQRIRYLINLLFCFQVAIWVVEGFKHHFDFSNIFIKTSIAFVLHLTYQKTLRNLQYSFWTFSLGIFLWLFNGLLENLLYFDTVLVLCYGIVFLIHVVILYQMSSPIYYPRVRWWEYDFRFQGDLKVHVEDGSQEKLNKPLFEARLTDLRRGAGCLAMFQDLDIGREYIIEIFEPTFPTKLRVKIMSKRNAPPGRGHIYGIKFIIHDSAEKVIFKELKNFWLNFKQARFTKKFEISPSG